MSDAHYSDRKPLVAFKLFLTASWLLVIVIVLLNSTVNGFGIPASRRNNFVAITPEGWAFFTRNPREAISTAFTSQGGRWREIEFARFGPGNILAFRREVRLIEGVFADLIEQVPSKQWKAVRLSRPSTLDALSLPPIRVTKHAAVLSQLCGDIVIQVVEPVPWAWAGFTPRVAMPSKVTRLEVACP